MAIELSYVVERFDWVDLPIKISAKEIDLNVDWGDGKSSRVTSLDGSRHQYENAGKYVVKLSGKVVATAVDTIDVTKQRGKVNAESAFGYDDQDPTSKHQLVEAKGDLGSISSGVSDFSRFMWRAFYKCDALVTASFTGLTVTNEVVTDYFGEAFWGCTGLKSATIPPISGVVTKYTGNDATQTFVETNVPGSVTNVDSYLSYAFYGCTSLGEDGTKLPAIPALPIGVTKANFYLSGTFCRCTKLKTSAIPTLPSLPAAVTSATHYFYRTFLDCWSIEPTPKLPAPPTGTATLPTMPTGSTAPSGNKPTLPANPTEPPVLDDSYDPLGGGTIVNLDYYLVETYMDCYALRHAVAVPAPPETATRFMSGFQIYQNDNLLASFDKPQPWTLASDSGSNGGWPQQNANNSGRFPSSGSGARTGSGSESSGNDAGSENDLIGGSVEDGGTGGDGGVDPETGNSNDGSANGGGGSSPSTGNGAAYNGNTNAVSSSSVAAVSGAVPDNATSGVKLSATPVTPAGYLGVTFADTRYAKLPVPDGSVIDIDVQWGEFGELQWVLEYYWEPYYYRQSYWNAYHHLELRRYTWGWGWWSFWSSRWEWVWVGAWQQRWVGATLSRWVQKPDYTKRVTTHHTRYPVEHWYPYQGQWTAFVKGTLTAGGGIAFSFGNVPDSANSVVKIDGSFSAISGGCTEPSAWFANLCSGCKNLQVFAASFPGIPYNADAGVIPTRAHNYFSGSFNECTSLATFNSSFPALPSTITSMNYYFSETFYNCGALKTQPAVPDAPVSPLLASYFMYKTFCNSGITGQAAVPLRPEDAIVMKQYFFRTYGNCKVSSIRKKLDLYPWEWEWPEDPDPEMGNQCFANCTSLGDAFYKSIPQDWTIIERPAQEEW